MIETLVSTRQTCHRQGIYVLGTPKRIVEKSLRIFLIRPLRIRPPFRQSPRQIRNRQFRRSIRHLASRLFQQLVDQLQIWLALIRNQRLVLAGQAGVVLDGIVGVQAEVFQIEAVVAV